MLGTEIRTFTTLKELGDYLADHLDQYKMLYEDYSQWLGSLLRSCEEAHKNEEWYQNSAALQKGLAGAKAKASGNTGNKKGKGKGKKRESSVWIQSGDVMLSSTEQGQAEVLFEAIEKIGDKIQEMEKFKATVQQLERLGLGKKTDYIVYIEDDIPRKIVVRAKSGLPEEEAFKFAAELSVPAFYSDFSGK
jgi:predicted DNA-binding protein